MRQDCYVETNLPALNDTCENAFLDRYKKNAEKVGAFICCACSAYLTLFLCLKIWVVNFLRAQIFKEIWL